MFNFVKSLHARQFTDFEKGPILLIPTDREKDIRKPSFSDEYIDVLVLSDIVDGINQRAIDWRHYVSEESRCVRLDEDESGQAPNASDKTKR